MHTKLVSNENGQIQKTEGTRYFGHPPFLEEKWRAIHNFPQRFCGLDRGLMVIIDQGSSKRTFSANDVGCPWFRSSTKITNNLDLPAQAAFAHCMAQESQQVSQASSFSFEKPIPLTRQKTTLCISYFGEILSQFSSFRLEMWRCNKQK